MSQKAYEEFEAARNRVLSATQTIELDCAPGNPRPSDLLPGVIKDTGLTYRDPVSIFFGNWTWDYSDIAAEEWQKIKPTLKERITFLYNKGLIRYGSW
jgi:hypothetical protein